MKPHPALRNALKSEHHVDPEVAAAMRATEGVVPKPASRPTPRGNNSDAGDDESNSDDEDDSKKPDFKRRAKDGKPYKPKERGKTSSMAELFKKALEQDDSEAGDGEQEYKNDNSGKQKPNAAKPDKKDGEQKPGEGEDKEFTIKKTEGEDPTSVSSNVSARFKAYREAEAHNEKVLKALQEKLKAAEEAAQKASSGDNKAPSTSLEEQEGYKALKAERDALEERLEKLNLLESPRFKQEFDTPIVNEFKGAVPFIKTLKSEEDQSSLTQKLSSLYGITAGEDHDGVFFNQLEDILEGYELSGAAKTRITSRFEKIRDLVNRREEATAKWRETSKEFKTAHEKQAHSTAQEAIEAFRRYRQEHESHPDNAKLISGFRAKYKNEKGEEKDIFGYDQTINAAMLEVEPAIKDSILKGGPTPELLKMVYEGVQSRFTNRRIQMMVAFIADQTQQLQKAREELEKIKGSRPGKGGDPNSSSKPADEDNKAPGKRGILASLQRIQKDA